ncbi:hypothetical protein ISN75_12055 [Dyella marensis]|uniref:hypothetical protein n=1 Tax=Dyella marensis TaxID=500610 RepID=UPI0031E29AAD
MSTPCSITAGTPSPPWRALFRKPPAGAEGRGAAAVVDQAAAGVFLGLQDDDRFAVQVRRIEVDGHGTGFHPDDRAGGSAKAIPLHQRRGGGELEPKLGLIAAAGLPARAFSASAPRLKPKLVVSDSVWL